MAEDLQSKLFLLKSKLRATLPTSRQMVRAPELRRGLISTSGTAGVNESNMCSKVPSSNQATIEEETIAPSMRIRPMSQQQVITDIPDNDQTLKPCADCGRLFNTESLERHNKICKKVFKSKRTTFDSIKIRLMSLEEQLPGLTASLTPQSRGRGKTPAIVAQKPAPLRTGWRRKSDQFRNAIGSIRNENSSPPIVYPDEQPSSAPNITHCPHCARGFNEDAARRHIAVCQKLFGTRPDRGRLLRGSGNLCHSTSKKPENNPPSSSHKLGSSTIRSRR